jgi:hypothetical protein
VIDARSASRYGKHDLGANASRIRSLLDDVDEEVNVRTDQQERAARKKPPPKPVPTKKPQPEKR